MNQQVKKKLEAKGWQIGSATDFLGLTAKDLLIIRTKLLAGWVERRLKRHLAVEPPQR